MGELSRVRPKSSQSQNAQAKLAGSQARTGVQLNAPAHPATRLHRSAGLLTSSARDKVCMAHCPSRTLYGSSSHRDEVDNLEPSMRRSPLGVNRHAHGTTCDSCAIGQIRCVLVRTALVAEMEASSGRSPESNPPRRNARRDDSVRTEAWLGPDCRPAAIQERSSLPKAGAKRLASRNLPGREEA